MKKIIKKKFYKISLFFLFIILALGSVWHLKNKKYAVHLVSKPKDVKMWEADPRSLQSESAALKQIKKINNENKGQDISLNKMELVVIPGLRGAWSINPKSGKATFGTDWVPQGVTQSEDNYYISAYDGEHHLNSLIFQIDKKTKKYVKTLILDSKAHVGGIIYDQKYKQLIYSDDTKKCAGLGYISKKNMDSYHANRVKAPIHSKVIKWDIASRTSAITLYNNQLLVAKYGLNKDDRSIVAVPCDNKGLITVPSTKDLNQVNLEMTQESSETKDNNNIIKKYIQILTKMKLINSYNPAWDRLQGIAVSKTGLTFLTQSNGYRPGELMVRVQEVDKTYLKFHAPKVGFNKISIPASVEGISLNSSENHIALVFESGAKEYRNSNLYYMDRLIILPISITINDND